MAFRPISHAKPATANAQIAARSRVRTTNSNHVPNTSRREDVSPDSNRTDDGEYLVGRNRTPVATRWKPGQSGNPKGRPRKKPPTLDIHEIVMELMAKELRVSTPTGSEVSDHLRVLLRKTYEIAVKGNLSASRMLVGLLSDAQAKTAAQFNPDEQMSDDEMNVLTTLLNAIAPNDDDGAVH
jgi:hypothetical protein